MNKKSKEAVEILLEMENINEDEIRLMSVPYRICILGEHTDHQLGLVSGMTIFPGIWMAFSPREDSKVRVGSADFEGTYEFDLEDIPEEKEHWARYAAGAAWVLKNHPEFEEKITKGFDCVVVSEGPVSAGLSSSAAVGVGYQTILLEMNDVLDYASTRDRILLNKLLENEYLGLNNGILDQGMILTGQKDSFTSIDCLDFYLEEDDFYRSIHAPEDIPEYSIFILDTGKRRDLTLDNAYNEKVKLCHEAGKRLSELSDREYDDDLGLRQFEPELFAVLRPSLPEDLRDVATHVFDENERVIQGNEAFENGDLEKLGLLINASGDSLHYLFGVGSDELRYMTKCAREVEGVYGARQVGAGFGGVVLVLADPSAVDSLEDALQKYEKRYPEYENSALYVCESTNGIKIYDNASLNDI